MRLLERFWYWSHPLTLLIRPLAWGFCAIALLRRWLYRAGILPRQQLGVPVIVVGNITVGGTGKTPLVIWLTRKLREAGYRPGIVSRGYGGRSRLWPQRVSADSDPDQVGDEPVLLARQTRCPIMVAPDRVAAARALLKSHYCDVIVTDDGLQHYRLARFIEIAVVDGKRRFGNGACLPVGPLREPRSRLATVDYVVSNGPARSNEYAMTLKPGRAINLSDPDVTCALTSFRGSTLHAVAGIGYPERFFALLRSAGIAVIEHPFADHHRFSAAELDFGDELPILMTEKDAVKCQALSGFRCWYLPVQAVIDDAFWQALESRLQTFDRGVTALPNLTST